MKFSFDILDDFNKNNQLQNRKTLLYYTGLVISLTSCVLILTKNIYPFEFLIFLIGIGCIWRSKFNEDSTYEMCYIFLCFLGIEGIGFLSEMCFQI
jgi:hypothetical protein